MGRDLGGSEEGEACVEGGKDGAGMRKPSCRLSRTRSCGALLAASLPPVQATQHADWLAGGCETAAWVLLLPVLGAGAGTCHSGAGFHVRLP